MADVPTENEPDTQNVEKPHSDPIRQNYGTRPFKCPFVGCSDQRIGFETKDLRQAHCEGHGRSWRCEDPTCEYNAIGFLSRRMRDDHQAQSHTPEDPEPPVGRSLTSNDQLVALLLSLIRADKVKSVESLLVSAQDSDTGQNEALFEEVMSSGSYNMIEAVGTHLVDKLSDYGIDPEQRYGESAAIAARAGNVATLKWLATKVRDKAVLLNPNHYLFVDGFGRALEHILKSDKPAALYDHFEKIAVEAPLFLTMEPRIISATSGRRQSEGILISLWRKLCGNAGYPLVLGGGLRSVAATTCSVALASVLIDLGVDLEYKPKSKVSPSSLQLAARKDTNEAASFIRFLLYRGANPQVEYNKKRKNGMTSEEDVTRIKVSEEVGAKGISKWLNKSWEELVAEAREARMNNNNPPIPGD